MATVTIHFADSTYNEDWFVGEGFISRVLDAGETWQTVEVAPQIDSDGDETGWDIDELRERIEGLWPDVEWIEIPTSTRLEWARLRDGSTQAQAAESIGCSQQAYSDWETGARLPSPQYGQAINKALDIWVITSAGKGRPPSTATIRVYREEDKDALLALDSWGGACGGGLDIRWAALIELLGYHPDPEDDYWGLTHEERCIEWSGRRGVIEQRGDSWRVAVEGAAGDWLAAING